MPRTPQSGVEEWLARWAGEEIVPREPQSRVEQQLARLAGVNIVPESPQSPEEDWLEIIYQNGGGGGITPTGTISITENGEYDVTQYAGANVDVWQGFDYRGLSGVKFAYSTDTSIDLSTLDTSEFTSMKYMFNNCEQLTALDLSHFDTSNVTDMANMFWNCNALTSLDVSSFDTSKVTTTWSMFRCSVLPSLDTSSFKTPKVKTFNQMFYQCSLLTSLNLQGFSTPEATNMTQFIQGCTALTDIIWAIDSTTMQPLVTAKAFDKAADTVPSDLNIWVRDSLLTQYQQATNWIRYANCFKKISELPQALQTLYNIDPTLYP